MQEGLNEPGWKGQKEWVSLETKAWHRQTPKKKMTANQITSLKKLEQIELPAKLLNYFL